jgi:hypothetical protein
MPMERDRYPKNWPLTARKIKEASSWCCEQCGKPCRKPGERVEVFKERLDSRWLAELVSDPISSGQLVLFTIGGGEREGAQYRPRRFLLTVGHLDQDPGNGDRENLKAFCAPCHLRYDSSFIGFNRRRKKERRGQLNLLTGQGGQP